MKLILEVNLTAPEHQKLGFAVPLIHTILRQLIDNCSPDLHLIDTVLGDSEEGLLIETADTTPKSEVDPEFFGTAPEYCNARMYVTRDEFDTRIRTHDAAQREGCETRITTSEFQVAR